MCALTYVPIADGGFVLTHNRDEHSLRPKAIEPQLYMLNGQEAWYPLDPQSGGTWFAWDAHRVACLLNGGFQAHQRKASYRMSRGNVILGLLSETNSDHFMQSVDFSGMEPFTLIIFEKKLRQLIQLVWDERICHILHPNASVAHIWSSATLYNDDVQVARGRMFTQQLPRLQHPEACWAFHRANAGADAASTLYIKSEQPIKTVATLQVFGRGSDNFWRYEAINTTEGVTITA
jgi:Transport and Golgi organisation 2